MSVFQNFRYAHRPHPKPCRFAYTRLRGEALDSRVSRFSPLPTAGGGRDWGLGVNSLDLFSRPHIAP
jgi:hypothetical protein